MLLISFASVASMIIFMRLCSYSTPSSRTYHSQPICCHPLFLPPPLATSQSHPMVPPIKSMHRHQRQHQMIRGRTRRIARGLPREQFVPPFRLKRRRTTGPISGVERHVSEIIPASSVPLPYQRSRGRRVRTSASPPPASFSR